MPQIKSKIAGLAGIVLLALSCTGEPEVAKKVGEEEILLKYNPKKREIVIYAFEDSENIIGMICDDAICTRYIFKANGETTLVRVLTNDPKYVDECYKWSGNKIPYQQRTQAAKYLNEIKSKNDDGN